jgi:hypothetical protein
MNCSKRGHASGSSSISLDRAGFAMAKVVERISGLAAHQLPPSFSREIGRIIVKFAYFEQCVQEMIWQALELSEAAGRIAVREPRITDRLDMLRDVIGLLNSAWDEELFKSMRQRANLIAAKRHMLVHGLWYHHPLGEWHVQLTRGSWPKTEEELVVGSKKITPESVPIAADELKSATAEIDALIADLKRLRSSAHGVLGSLPETLPEQSHPPDRTPGPTPSKRPRPRRSSRASPRSR